MSNDPPTADAKPQASTDEGSGERSLPAIDWAALRRRNDRRRARRRQVGGAVGAALLAAVFLGAWIATRGEEQPPVRYTAELPTVFDDYRLAGPGESLWDKTGIGENLDPTTETAHATYVRSDGKKSFIITVDLDPVADVSDPGEGDDIVSMILGTSVDSAEAKSYDPGSIAGKLLCVQYAVAGTTSSRCLWGNGTALVTAQPVVTSGPRPTPKQTAAEVRSFLGELHVHPVT